MRSIGLTKDESMNIQALLGRRVLAVDVPENEVPTSISSLRQISSIRLAWEDNTCTFFSVKSFDIVEGVEVFLVEVANSLDLKRYPGGPSISWNPIVALADELKGSVIEDIRILGAKWQIIAGGLGHSYYGKHPVSLAHDLSGDAAAYHIEDGVALFFSNGSALTISAKGDLSGTLKIWYSKS